MASSSKLLLAGVSLLVFNACSSGDKLAESPQNRVTLNDFDSLDGWAPAVPVTTEKARSGRFSIKVGPGSEYSAGYTNVLSKVSAVKISKLMVNGWALRAGLESKAALVVTITDPAKGNEQVFWQAMDIHEQVKTYNTWTKVSKEFALPATIQPTHVLQVYMWQSNASKPTYLDDLEITKS